MRIFSIVGARPQFIKLAPLSAKLFGQHEEIIVHTGQHYDFAMSEQIFNDLGIRKPDISLGIGSGTHAQQTAEMMKSIEQVLLSQKPDIIIVFGDTNSTLAGALAAAKLHIPIIHIESGLRSYNKKMPEEINRIATDHISDYLFAPTKTAVKNLESEGLGQQTSLTGDIMVDTINDNIKLAITKSSILNDLKLESNKYNLLTLHRDYNVDNANLLENLLINLSELDEDIIFPIHPPTKKNAFSKF